MIRLHARVHWLSLGLLIGFAPAAASSPSDCQPPELKPLEAADGHTLLIHEYRPPEDPSAAILLLSRGERASACWGTLPGLLCEAGFQVLIPEPRENEAEVALPVGELPDAESAALLLQDVVRSLELVDAGVGQLALVAIGWTGWLGFDLAAADDRLSRLIWLSPQKRPPGEGVAEGSADPALTFLFVASPSEATASALAGDLFLRFNDRAELRFLSRSPGGCGLLHHAGLCEGLADWLAQPWSAQ